MERIVEVKWKQERIVASVHYPADRGPYDARTEEQSGKRLPLTVICHGFVGSRIGVDRLFVNAARLLADEGHIVVRFDYAGCGESTGVYGDLGIDAMLEQTQAVLDYALQCGDVDPQRVTLIGHSLGGAIALLTAGRDSQTDYLGYTFTPNYFETLGRHQPFQEASKFQGDVLLIHGTSDDVIPADYTFLYQKVFWMRSDGQCDKEIVFQADHTYSNGEHREQLYDKTLEWLRQWEYRQEKWTHWTI